MARGSGTKSRTKDEAKPRDTFDTDHVEALETFSGTLETDEVDRVKIGETVGEDGEPEDVFEEKPRNIPVAVRQGQIMPADEPVVQKYGRQFFREYDRVRPAAEQATAAPGERRG